MTPLNIDDLNKEAVKNAYTPEGLDQLVKITRPKGWIALLAILFFLVVLMIWSIFGRVISDVSAPCIIYPSSGGPVMLNTETPGYVLSFQAKPDQLIQSGDPILTVTKDGKNSVITSPMKGKLISFLIIPGQYLNPGTAYALFLPYASDNSLLAHVFVPPMYGKTINAGMQVHLALDQANPDDYGYLLGTVSSISLYPKTEAALANDLQNSSLISMMTRQGAPFEALVTLTTNPKNPNQYLWTKETSSKIDVSPGSLCTADIITAKQAPITLVIPALAPKLGN